MGTPHAADEADIRPRIDTVLDAVRAMDLEGAVVSVPSMCRAAAR